MDNFKKRKPCSDEELQKKIADLPPELQAQFLWATDMLLQRESTLFLEIIQESRNEINNISQEIKSDKTALRANISRLDKYNDGDIGSAKSATDKLNEFVEKRQKVKKVTNLNFQPDQEKEAVEKYLKAVGRHKDDDSVSKVDIPSYARPVTAGTNSRPGTAFKIRMDEIQPSDYNDSTEYKADFITVDPTLNKQQEELILRLKEQDTQAVSERERQIKMMEKKKAERQNKRIDSAGVRAADMIDQSRGVDEKQLQNKLQQEKIIHERLEKMKVNKNVSPINERSSTMLEENAHEHRGSLFEESKRELAIRPRTGESKSPAKSTEFIEMRTPVKSGWTDSGSQKNVSAMFEVNEQYPQQDIEAKKHKKKKHRKKNTEESAIETNNDIEIINFGE